MVRLNTVTLLIIRSDNDSEMNTSGNENCYASVFLCIYLFLIIFKSV